VKRMKLFGKWDPAEVEVADLSVKGYMNLASKSVMISGGRHAKQQVQEVGAAYRGAAGQ